MKILMINSVCGIRSTGRICTDLAKELENQGHKVKIAYGRENVPEEYQKFAVRISNNYDIKIDGVKSRFFDNAGFNSKRATNEFLKWADDYNPDILHLHNIHGYYINIELLFYWIKKRPEMKVIWTLHDCWAFTGHCAYFDFVNCDKWKKGCNACTQKKSYPLSLVMDNSKKNWKKKRIIFSGVNNMTIVTPSKWLADLVKQSFLKEYKVKVINNGIDTNIFKPTQSSCKKRYGIKDKKIILGVAAVWDRRKGLEDFIKLSEMIDDTYKIVLVGLTAKQIEKLPPSILGITRTNNPKELAEIYTAADVFFNPTYEDNYPTTNIESVACGTPVITYNTGGSPESAKHFGIVVSKGDINRVVEIINMKVKTNGIEHLNFGYMDTVLSYLKLYKER